MERVLVGFLLLFLQACANAYPDLSGTHYRLDDVSLTIAQARSVTESLQNEISSKTGLSINPVEVFTGTPTFPTAIHAVLNDDNGCEVSITIYSDEHVQSDHHSIFLEARGDIGKLFHINKGNPAREKELAEISRKAIEGVFPGHLMINWHPKSGLLGP